LVLIDLACRSQSRAYDQLSSLSPSATQSICTIAWRCGDSLGLKAFLGYGLAEATPDHSSLTYIRRRVCR
jgi:hypothetical protein